MLNLFATTPKGLELLLVEELKNLGATNAAEKLAGVSFSGDLSVAYQACLWSRLANRILLVLTKASAADANELYAAVQTINWQEHISPEHTIAVHCVCSQSNINHSLFAAQKAKDAIVDQLRDRTGERPNVSKFQPDVKVYIYLHRNQATICIDLSGESLHKRGYRLAQVAAPLKENLAAAILLRANWPAIAAHEGTLLDPMCGSGTLLIEAALMAANIAPGLNRDYFGFLGWKKHDKDLWQRLLEAAKQQVHLAKIPTIVGYDQDPYAIKAAFENIERAGLHGKIHVEKRDLENFQPRPTMQPGLVITNPPYGERLGEVEDLKPLYTQLGSKFKQYFVSWHAGVFTGNPDLGKEMGLRAERYYAFFNGPIACKLLLFDVQEKYFVDRSIEGENARRIRQAKQHVDVQSDSAIQMFVNRLRKNLKHLSKQAKRQNLESFRVYDADLPEYAFAIDIHKDAVYVQEYAAPKTISVEKVKARREAVLAVLPELLSVPPTQIFFSILPRDKG